jgi:WD40 repeat protein/predicted Ser/Thr protein kinase
MSAPHTDGSDFLPLSAEFRLDAACRRFEAAWKSGTAPRLEEYLGDCLGDERLALLRELIRLDLSYRRARGESPRSGDYLSRLPELEPTWVADLVRADLGLTEDLRGGGAPSASSVQSAGTSPSGAGPTLPRPPREADRSPLPDVAGYEVQKELGRGGMGVVYQARQLALKRAVALKMIRLARHAGPDDHKRFRVEAEAVARLQHPNIVQIYEIGESAGLPYFSLEYVEGGTLREQLAAAPLAPADAARLVAKLARAMHYAHQKGVIHRDLKPANVLLTKDGAPKVTDFGLAKQLDDDSGSTQTGMVLGTPSYMSPEQAGGLTEEIGPLTDVYALGAILYECLTGRPPFRGASSRETLAQVRSADPVPPSRLQPAVPRDLETVCLKCLEKDVARRYASAAGLADDLGRWLGHEPILARPAGRVERAAKWARRHPALAAVTGVLGLALTALLVVVSSFSLILADRNQNLQKKTIDLEAQGKVLTEQREELVAKKNELTNTVGQLKTTGEELTGQRNKAVEFGKKAQEEAGRAKKNEDLANLRAEAARRGQFAAYLSQVSLLAERQPQQAIAMLDDAQNCPAELRDFTWGMIHATSDRSLSSVCAAPASVLTTPALRGPADQGDGPAEAAFLTDQLLVTIAPLFPSGHRVRRFHPATGQMRGELLIDGPATLSEDRRTAVRFGTDRVLRRWDLASGRRVGEWRLDGPGEPRLTAFADNLSTLAFVEEGETVRLWDATSGRPRQALPPGETQITNLRFTPQGDRLVVFERDPESPCFRLASLWDVATGKRLRRLDGRVPAVEQTSVSADGRLLSVSGIDPSGLTVYDLATGKEIRVPPFDVHQTLLLAFGPRGQTLIHLQRGEGMMAGDPYCCLRIWDLGGAEPRPIQLARVAKMANHVLSRDHARITLNYPEGQVLVDTLSGQRVLQRESALDKFKALGFSPDGQVLVTSDSRLWGLPRGNELLSLRGGGPVAFSPNGQMLATQTDPNIFTVWNVEPELPYARALSWNVPVKSLALTPDGSAVAVLGGEIGGFPSIYIPEGRLIDLETSQVRATLSQGDRAGIGNLALSPDGRTFAIDRGTQLTLWDGDGGRRRRVEVPDGFEHILFLPNGREVALGGLNAVLFYGLDGKPAGKLESTEPLGPTVAMSADGAFFAGGTATGHVVVWERATGRRLTSPFQHRVAAPVNARVPGGAVRAVALSPDGRLAASGGTDGLVRVWDRGKETHLEIPGHVGSVNAVAFCGEGRTLCSGGEDCTVRFWDPVTGQLRASFRRHNFPITCMEVSRDGRTLVTGSAGKSHGGEVLVWRSLGVSTAAAGGAGRGLFQDADGILRAAFAPDGASLVTLARTGRLARWDLATGSPLPQPGRPPFTLQMVGQPQNVNFLSLELDEADKPILYYRRNLPSEALCRWHETEGEKVLHVLPNALSLKRAAERTISAPRANLSLIVEAPLSTGNPYRLTVRGSDLKTGKQAALLEDFSGSWLADSPDRRWMALMRNDGGAAKPQRSVVVVDVEKRAVAWEKALAAQQLGVIAFTPDGSGLHVPGLGTFAAETGKELAAAEKQPVTIKSPDGKIMLSLPPSDKAGAPPQPVEVREADGGKVLGTIRPRRGLVGACFSPDGKVVFARDMSFQYDEVLAWEVATGRETRFAGRSNGLSIEPGSNVAKFPPRLNALVPASDRLLLVVLSYRGVQVWDRTTGAERTDVRLPSVGEKALHFTPDHKLLMIQAEGACQVWDTTTWKTRKVLPASSGVILDASVSADGKTLMMVEPSQVRRWDLEKMQESSPVKFDAPLDRPGTHTVVSATLDSLVRLEQEPLVKGARRDIQVCSGPQGAERYHHEGEVEALALAADGKHAASAGTDHVIHVWDPADGTLLTRLAGHTAPVYLLEFVPGTDLLISAGDDGTVRVWDLAAKAKRGRLPGYENRLRAVAVSRDGRLLATGGDDGLVRLWDVGGLRPRATYRGHQSPVVSLAFAADSKRLASVASDGVARVWAVAAEEARPSADEEGWYRPAALSADGKTVFAGEKGGAVVAVEAATKARRTFAARHSGPVTALALSPDGSALASGGADGVVRLIDPATGKETASWEGPGGPVAALAFSPDGARLAAGAGRPPSLFAARRPSRIAVVDLKSKQTLGISGHDDGVRALAFSPDGKVLASAGDDAMARLWDAEAGGEIRQLRHAGPVLSVAYAADGRLFTGTLDPTIHWGDQFGANGWLAPLHTWDGKTGAYLGYLPVGGDTVRDLSVAGDLLAVAEDGGAVSVWDLRRNHGQFLVRADPQGVERVAVSRDGRTLLTTGAEGTARLWDVTRQRGRELLPKAAEGAFGGVALSPRGDLVLVLEEGRRGAGLRLYETATGKERASLSIDPRPLAPGWLNSRVGTKVVPDLAGIAVEVPRPLDMRLSADLHPFELDARPFAGGGLFGTMNFNPVTVARPQLPFLGPHPGRYLVAVGPEGVWAATAPRALTPQATPDRPDVQPKVPDETKVRLWNLKEGKPGATLSGHEGRVSALAFSPDGKLLATCGDDRVVRLWQVESGEPALRLEGHDHSVRSLRFSPDGAWLASGDEGQALHLWSVRTGKEGALLKLGAGNPPPAPGRPGPAEERAPATAAFTPDGQTLIVASLGAGRPIGTHLQSYAIRADGDRVVLTPGRDLGRLPFPAMLGGFDDGGHTVFVAGNHLLFGLDLERGGWLGQYSVRQGIATGGSIASILNQEEQGPWAAFAVRIDARSGQGKGESFTGLLSGTPTRPALSADGKRCLTFGSSGNPGGGVAVWNMDPPARGTLPASVKPLRLFEEPRAVVAGCLSPDGKTAALATKDGKVELVETASGKRLHSVGDALPLTALVFSPEGSLLAAAENGDEGAVRLWEVGEGKEKSRIRTGNKTVRALAFSPDGARLATGSADGAVVVWALPEGRRLNGWPGHQGPVTAVAFDGAGKSVVSGSSDGTVVVTDVATGQPSLKPRPYRSPVQSVALSDDARLLAVGLEAGVQVLDAVKGTPTQTLPVGAVHSVRFDAGGKDLVFGVNRLAPSDWRGSIRVNDPSAALRPMMELPLDHLP